LNGSRYFTEHPTVPLDKTSYMINMDMVGRLNDSSKTLTVGGYGTSPAWAQIFNSFRKNKNLNIRLDSSGTGPSDHTSFYRKDIPVLFSLPVCTAIIIVLRMMPTRSIIPARYKLYV